MSFESLNGFDIERRHSGVVDRLRYRGGGAHRFVSIRREAGASAANTGRKAGANTGRTAGAGAASIGRNRGASAATGESPG